MMHTLKNRLKKIKWLRRAVRKVKSWLRTAKKPFVNARGAFYLAKSKRRGHASEKIRIGFIAQVPTSWDKQMSVYESAKRRENTDVFLFVVPQENFDTYEIIPDYTDNYFCKHYPESIKLLDSDGRCLDLAQYRLDYLFYQRPYDYRLPEMIQSSRMVKYTKCCYLPYGFTDSVAFNNNMLNDIFFDNLYFFFADSRYAASTFREKFSYSVKKGLRRIEYLGYPSFEMYLNMRGQAGSGYLTWTPRWHFSSATGGSTFLVYKDKFTELIRKTGQKAIFRPHPLIYAELIRSNIMSDEEWRAYLKELTDLGVVVDTDSPIEDILKKTDILVSDYSSIVISYFLTGRPMIYCENGIVLTEDYNDMMKHVYVANSWDDVLRFYDDCTCGGDPQKDERARYIDEMYSKTIGSAEAILDCLCEDLSRG